MSVPAYMQNKIEERATLADSTTALLEKCAKDGRDPSDEERQRLDNWEARCKILDGELADLEAQFRGNEKFQQLAGRIGRHAEQREERAAEERTKPKPETRSVGHQFIGSDAFKGYRGRGSTSPVEFAGFLENRAAISLDTLGDVVPAHQWSGPTDPSLRTPLLDVIGREVTTSGSVEYITWSDASVAGGPIAEGELKPEAELTAKITPVALETYAHWKSITRQALEDFPRIQSIVDTKLRVGLAKKLESVAAGVINAAGFASVTNDDAIAGARHAIGVVQEAGFEPNAILLNPSDYATFDIQAAEAAGNGPVQFGTFWGLQAVPVSTVPVGTQYVGDFQEAVTWFDRNTAAVYLTDSHADYMIRNLLLILAEQRAAFAATNLAAAVKVTAAAEPEGLRATAKAKA